MPSVQSARPGLGIVPGPRAFRPRNGLRDSNRGQDALGPERPARPWHCPPDRGRSALETVSGTPIEGRMPSVRSTLHGLGIVAGPRAFRPRKGFRDSSRGQDALGPKRPTRPWRCPSARGRPVLESDSGVPIEGSRSSRSLSNVTAWAVAVGDFRLTWFEDSPSPVLSRRGIRCVAA